MDELDEVEYTKILSNQLASISFQCQNIEKYSFIKGLHKTPDLLLISKTSGKEIKQRDIQLLTSYELPFYPLNMQMMNYRTSVLEELCMNQVVL